MRYEPRRWEAWSSEEASPPGAVASHWTHGIDGRDGAEVLRFWFSDEPGPADVDNRTVDPALPEADVRRLISLVFFRHMTDDHYVDTVPSLAFRRLGDQGPRHVVPYPPRSGDVVALLEATEHTQRVRWLHAAATSTVRYWQGWVRGANLQYFSGISMERVAADAPQAALRAVEAWLGGDDSLLAAAIDGVPMALSAMAQFEWEIDDKRAEYCFLATYNLVRLCVDRPTATQASVVFRQIASAMAVDANDGFRGDEVIQDFVDAWWWSVL